jgi:hypothetical protein
MIANTPEGRKKLCEARNFIYFAPGAYNLKGAWHVAVGEELVSQSFAG